MKIVTWNINSVRLRLDLLKSLIHQLEPDVICLQETKVQDTDFPALEIQQLGYSHIVFSGEKSYNGVAILSKHQIEQTFCLDFDLSQVSPSFFVAEGNLVGDRRHIAATINGIEVHNFYVPAGGDEPDIGINPKFKHKLQFISAMEKWFLDNRETAHPIILAGDLNIAPHEHDVWSSKQLRNVVSHTDVERKALISLQKSFEFIDSTRHFVDIEHKLYSWWSYRNRDWEKSNRGRRLDHIWASKALQGRLGSALTLKEARSWDRPSDHVPVMLSLV